MSTEIKTYERVFAIRKQTFRQKNPLNRNWTVNLKAYDNFGEEERVWQIHNSNSNYNFNFSGSDKSEEHKYQKCFCKVTIYDKLDRKFMSRKGYMNGPSFKSFNFTNIYRLEREINYDIIDFSFTIATCHENKSKPFELQKKMLDESILTDMVIETKDQQFPCHKFVLAAESEYFRTMFQIDMKEKNSNTLDWTGIFEATVVKDLLHFFYTGQKPPNVEDNHFKLMEVAQLCLLPKLKVICAESIGGIIQVDNAARVLQAAELYESEELKTTAVKYVVANCPQVLATEDFKKMDTNIKSRLLASVLQVINKINPKLLDGDPIYQ